MILPLWRSLYSLNLMLPKEERRAMLLRIFNDETPLVNTTQKRDAAVAAAQAREDDELETPLESGIEQQESEAMNEDAADDTLPSREEEQAIKEGSLALGQEEQDRVNARGTYGTVDGEADVMDTTV